MTAIIAIYGAILSTIVAFLHIRSFYVAQQFVYVQISRSWNLEQEFVEFLICNRSNLVTEIREVMIGNYGNGGKVGFHMLWGHSVSLFKDARSKVKLPLPVVLSPGEAVTCTYSSGEAVADIEKFSKARVAAGMDDVNSNLFYVEVEHSRANRPREVMFEIGEEYLGGRTSSWRALTTWRNRWRFWPVDRTS
jgi:hypothetical protein